MLGKKDKEGRALLKQFEKCIKNLSQEICRNIQVSLDKFYRGELFGPCEAVTYEGIILKKEFKLVKQCNAILKKLLQEHTNLSGEVEEIISNRTHCEDPNNDYLKNSAEYIGDLTKNIKEYNNNVEGISTLFCNGNLESINYNKTEVYPLVSTFESMFVPAKFTQPSSTFITPPNIPHLDF